MSGRIQLRMANTLTPHEIPLEGEAFWDDINRRIGFYNFAAGQIDWFRIPRPGDSDNYIPAHQWDGSSLAFRNPDGTWGNSVNLAGTRITGVGYTDNSDGTFDLIFETDQGTLNPLTLRLFPLNRGTWASDTLYFAMDEVFYNGSTYRVRPGVEPPIGTLPTNTVYFYPVVIAPPAQYEGLKIVTDINYDLMVADRAFMISRDNAARNTVNIRLQANVPWPDKWFAYVTQGLAGQTVYTWEAGVNVRVFSSRVGYAGQNASGMVMRLAQDDWIITGNLIEDLG